MTNWAYKFVNYGPNMSIIATHPDEPARFEAGNLRSS
jgi:hypothetical protein